MSRSLTGASRFLIDLATAVSRETERRLLGKYVAAWRANDVPALLSLLRKDALLTMPPFPAADRGRDAIGQFLRTVPAGGRLDQITLTPARANLQPRWRPMSVMPTAGAAADTGSWS